MMILEQGTTANSPVWGLCQGAGWLLPSLGWPRALAQRGAGGAALGAAGTGSPQQPPAAPCFPVSFSCNKSCFALELRCKYPCSECALSQLDMHTGLFWEQLWLSQGWLIHMQAFGGFVSGRQRGSSSSVWGSVGTSQGREEGEWSLPICAQGCLLPLKGTLVVGTFLFLQSADYQRDLLGCLLE